MIEGGEIPLIVGNAVRRRAHPAARRAQRPDLPRHAQRPRPVTGPARVGPRWIKTPIGGAGKLSTFVTLLGANKLHVAVIIDSSTKDTGAVRRLRDNGQLAASGLIEISEFTGTSDADIEDLFERDFYLDLVNRAYATEITRPLTPSDLNQHDQRGGPGNRSLLPGEQHRWWQIRSLLPCHGPAPAAGNSAAPGRAADRHPVRAAVH